MYISPILEASMMTWEIRMFPLKVSCLSVTWSSEQKKHGEQISGEVGRHACSNFTGVKLFHIEEVAPSFVGTSPWKEISYGIYQNHICNSGVTVVTNAKPESISKPWNGLTPV